MKGFFLSLSLSLTLSLSLALSDRQSGEKKIWPMGNNYLTIPKGPLRDPLV